MLHHQTNLPSLTEIKFQLHLFESMLPIQLFPLLTTILFCWVPNHLCSLLHQNVFYTISFPSDLFLQIPVLLTQHFIRPFASYTTTISFYISYQTSNCKILFCQGLYCLQNFSNILLFWAYFYILLFPRTINLVAFIRYNINTIILQAVDLNYFQQKGLGPFTIYNYYQQNISVIFSTNNHCWQTTFWIFSLGFSCWHLESWIPFPWN